MDFKYNLEFTDDCKNEILEIYEYISQNLASTEAAKKLMKKIKTSIMHLSEEPYLYMRIDIVLHNNKPMIMEVELAEPDLLFKFIPDEKLKNESVNHFAKKLIRRIEK